MTGNDKLPNEIELLLPWYVAGRLSDEEVREVEEYLGRHPEILSQIEMIKDEQIETIAGNEEVGFPSHDAVDKLMTRIASEPRPRSEAFLTSLLERLDGWFAAITPQQRLAVAFACLAIIVAQGFVIGLATGPRSASYDVAASKQPADEREKILVSFAPSATAGEISELLIEMEAFIVDGPRPGGMYRLAIAPTRQIGDVIDDLLAKKDIVVFAAEESSR